MTFNEFANALRTLGNLGRADLEEIGVIGVGDHNAWGTYKRDPFRWFVRADDKAAAKLFELMQRRFVSAGDA